MESYILRIYRRDSEKVAGLLIDASSGKQHSFHSLQQLGQSLHISDAAGGLDNQSIQNLNKTETQQNAHSEKESS